MSHRCPPGMATRWLGAAACMGVIGCALPALATGASAPPPIVSATSCNGSLSRAATSEEPNLLSYKFHCDWGITAYSLVVTRRPDDFNTLDDFSPTADVVDVSGNIVPTEGLSCSGTIPGNGLSCTPGAEQYVAAPDYVEGTIDTSDPYCANIPAGTTRVEPLAIAELIVTDTRGAQDGPFRLSRTPDCGAWPKPKAKARANKNKRRRKRHVHTK